MNKQQIMSMAVAVCVSGVSAWAQTPTSVDYSDLTLPPNSFWNGSDVSGGFVSGAVHFQNAFTDWGYDFTTWAGFAYSNVNAPSTPGYFNQYAVMGGTGVGGSGIYAVGYDDSFDPEADTITLPEPSLVEGFFVNNTAYAGWSMLLGDLFAKKFGGPTGDDPDWFMLEVTGKDEAGAVLGSVEYYLADYRFADNAQDYVQTEWEWLDLSDLGVDVKTLHFSATSSDTAPWGVNTPTYFALDNLSYILKSDCAPPVNCVRKASYWEQNPGAWKTLCGQPIATVDLTGDAQDCPDAAMTALEALELLEAKSHGNVSVKLAQETITAILNLEQGADATLAETLIQEACDYLCVVPVGSDPDDKELKKAGKTLAKALASFNKGKLNVPTCTSGSGGRNP